ncbi:MAG: transcription termination factor Rho [Thermoguttaceae bacterium]|nr:transcription termination factor Rho [Thermoguttaceae bacterium]
MNRNDDASSRPRPRKTVDEFLDEMDAWDKIAAGIDDAASFDFDSNAEFPWSGRAKKSDENPDDATASSAPPQKPSRPGAYLVDYDETDKIDEDYETRAKRREKSVWNRDGAQRYDRRFDDAARSNDNSRDGYYRDRDRYRASSENDDERDGGRPRYYRQDDRGLRDGDGERFDRRDGRRPNPNYRDYRRNNYRENGYRNENRDGNGQTAYFNDGRRPYYRDGNAQNGGGYRDGGRREKGCRDGNYQNDGYRRQPRRDFRNPNGDYRQNYRSNYRDDYRRFDDAGPDSDYYSPRGPRRRRDYYENLEPTVGALGKRGEPLSLAEELAARRGKPRYGSGSNGAGTPNADVSVPNDDRDWNDELQNATAEERQEIVELEQMDARELVAEARRQNLETVDGERRRDLVVRVLRARLQKNGLMYGEGTLEILPDEFGFLRSASSRYLSCPDDIYISPSQIRRFGLRDGLSIFGQIRPPKERERYFALLRVETINDEDPNALASKPHFDELTPALPTERVDRDAPGADLDLRLFNLLAPLGLGGRGLLVSPPRAGKTTFIQKAAEAVLADNPDAFVFVVLIDERPEELIDMERRLRGPRCEVVGATFDETAARHVQVAEIALEKAKRMVEYGRDVVFFLDSLTRLTRAWNLEVAAATLAPPTPGVLDPTALLRAKKYFGSARNVDGGGSLTLVATARLDETGGPDDQILEEFKGAGNWEVWLDRSLAEKRVWPAINVVKSAANWESSDDGDEKTEKIAALRRRLAAMEPVEAIQFLREKLAETETNAEFLASIDPKTF